MNFGVLRLVFGSYLAPGLERLFHPWFVLGYWRGNAKEDTRESNLNKSTLYEKISIKERGASNETPLKY